MKKMIVVRSFAVESEEEFTLEEGLQAIRHWENDYARSSKPQAEYVLTRRRSVEGEVVDSEVTISVIDTSLNVRPQRGDREDMMF